jgi:hypothetical protein
MHPERIPPRPPDVIRGVVVTPPRIEPVESRPPTPLEVVRHGDWPPIGWPAIAAGLVVGNGVLLAAAWASGIPLSITVAVCVLLSVLWIALGRNTR